MSVAPSATGWPAGQALLPNKVAPSPGGGMLPRGQALRSAPHTLSVGGRAAPRSLRASSPRAPTPARAAAHDPDKALAKNASKKFDPTVSSRFFNREFEFKYLNTLFDGNPRDIILLTGPQNCGKTVSDGPPQHTPTAPQPPFACAPRSAHVPDSIFVDAGPGAAHNGVAGGAPSR
jgi:hypothetical protein